MSALRAREVHRRSADVRRWVGQQIREQRLDSAITQAQLAACSGIEQGYISKIEVGAARPSLDVLIALAACLGADLGVRIFPSTSPRVRDRFQAPMIEALIDILGPGWHARPEVVVVPARGAIDLVLSRALDRLTVACECHSELRRLELVLRRANEKAEGLRGQLGATESVSRMLLLRSTRSTREIAQTFEATLAAAYPARSADALAALRGRTAWPGPAILWVRVDAGTAVILDSPPRGVRVGR
jgi:transcriptional regulator with XRE-family HTH domain